VALIQRGREGVGGIIYAITQAGGGDELNRVPAFDRVRLFCRPPRDFVNASHAFSHTLRERRMIYKFHTSLDTLFIVI